MKHDVIFVFKRLGQSLNELFTKCSKACDVNKHAFKAEECKEDTGDQ